MIVTLLTKLMGGGIAVSLLAAGVQTWRAGEAADARDAALAGLAFQKQQALLAADLADEMRATLAGERARHGRTLEQIASLQRHSEGVSAQLRRIRHDTRTEEDGPVAPVLRRTLDGLRQRDAGTGDPGGAEDRAHQSDHPAAAD